MATRAPLDAPCAAAPRRLERAAQLLAPVRLRAVRVEARGDVQNGPYAQAHTIEAGAGPEEDGRAPAAAAAEVAPRGARV